ncbi:hypothetical protein [Streptomyces sp. NPDC056669]
MLGRTRVRLDKGIARMLKISARLEWLTPGAGATFTRSEAA